MSAAYADTGFIASLYLEESTSPVAERVFSDHGEPLLLSPLVVLELRTGSRADYIGTTRRRLASV